MTDPLAYNIQQIDELAETWRLAGVDADLIAEAVRLLKEALEEPPDVSPWEDFFNRLKDEVGSFTDIAIEAAEIIWRGFSGAISNAVGSLLTMKETNARIKEDMAKAEADYLDEMADLQEDYNEMVSDGIEELAREKEDYYDDLTALELSYNRKVSDGIKDLARENEDYDIDMRRLNDKRNEAIAKGDDERAKYYAEKMEDCKLAHERAVEDITEKQEELTEDHGIEMDSMEEDHKDAMDAIKEKQKEQAEDAKTKIGEVETKHEELMEGMEGEMTTIGGVAETFWEEIKTAGIEALTAVITKLIQKAVLYLIGLGPVGWAILLGVGAIGAIWSQSKSIGGEIKGAISGVTKFATGGGTDTVPIMATAGEYVVAKPMVDFIKNFRMIPGSLTEAIAGGTPTPAPAFAGGGLIGNTNITPAGFGGTKIYVDIHDNRISDEIDIKRLATTVSNEILRKINLIRRH
ncbi:hypothetical protein ES705_33816 [subsurface metagenome]